MKAKLAIFMAAFLIPVNFAVQDLRAQTKTKEQEQAELKLQQEIEQQKKEMVDFQKSLEEQQKTIDQQVPSNNINNSPDSRFNDPFYGRPINGQFSYSNQPDRFTPGRVSWDFSKSVSEATFSKEYGIDVDKGSKNVAISISGNCKSGEIQITILAPGGKTFSEAVIDEFGNLNWRKSFQITEENTDKIGEWKFIIKSKTATGNFNISFQVN